MGTLDCFATLAMTDKKDCRVALAMTGEWIATIFCEGKFDSSVIARSEATKQSREGTWVHWIASLRSQ